MTSTAANVIVYSSSFTDGDVVAELSKADATLVFHVTDAAGVAAAADAVEAYLLLNGSATGKTYTPTAGATGTYTVIIPSTDLSPGQNALVFRALNQVNHGTDNHILSGAQVKSGTLNITPQTGLKEADLGSPVWKKVTLTGAAIKAATGVNSGATKTVVVFTLPTGTLLTAGCAMKVRTADGGAATTATASLGTNSTAYNDLLAGSTIRSAAEVDESTSFVPKIAASGFVKSVITVTGTGKTIADIDDAATFDFYLGYINPSV